MRRKMVLGRGRGYPPIDKTEVGRMMRVGSTSSLEFVKGMGMVFHITMYYGKGYKTLPGYLSSISSLS